MSGLAHDLSNVIAEALRLGFEVEDLPTAYRKQPDTAAPAKPSPVPTAQLAALQDSEEVVVPDHNALLERSTKRQRGGPLQLTDKEPSDDSHSFSPFRSSAPKQHASPGGDIDQPEEAAVVAANDDQPAGSASSASASSSLEQAACMNSAILKLPAEVQANLHKLAQKQAARRDVDLIHVLSQLG